MQTWTRTLCCLLAAVAGFADAAHAADNPSDTLTAVVDTHDVFPVDRSSPVDPAAQREVFVDTSAFTGLPGGDWISYDADQVVSSKSLSQIGQVPPWAVTARLLLAEVGDRMTRSRYGMVEAVGVVQSIQNRLNPKVWNPSEIAGIRPWPGCGDGNFYTCVNAQQYLGLAMPNALTPLRGARDTARVYQQVDAAVSAWWIATQGYSRDVTEGGTAFMHRCGGTAYGQDRSACDGRGDRPGAQPTTGPIVFRGAGSYSRRLGRYTMVETRTVDFIADSGDAEEGLFAAYLWNQTVGADWVATDFQTDADVLDAIWSGDLTAISDVIDGSAIVADASRDTDQPDRVQGDGDPGPAEAKEAEILSPLNEQSPDPTTESAPERPSTPYL